MKKFFTLAAAACISAGMFAAETVYDLTPVSWDPGNGASIDMKTSEFGFNCDLGEGILPIEGAHGTVTCDEAGFSTNINIKMFAPMPGMEMVYTVVEDQPTVDGTYVINMPEGQWGDADFRAGNGGHANAAFTYTYTVVGLGSGGSTTSCEITSYEPASGSTLAKLGTGDYIVINTTDNSAVDYFQIFWYDVTYGEDEDHRIYIRQSYGNHNYSPDPIIYEGTIQPLEFITGHRYRADVTLYSQDWMGPTTPIAAEGSVYYDGATAAFEYSPVRLLNIEPNPETYVIESTDFTTTLIFDGWMEVDMDKSGYGAGLSGTHFGLPAGSVTYNDEHTEVSVKWPESYFDDCGPAARMFLVLYDKDGLIYDNGEGFKENSMIEFTYQCETSGCQLLVTPEPGEVTELTSFACSIGSKYGGEMNISYTSPNATLVRMDMVNGDEVVYEFGYPDVTQTTGSGQTTKNVEFTFTLPEPITEPGRYALEIPYGYFNCGSEFDEARTLRYVGIYSIEGTVNPGEVVYDMVPDLDGSIMTTDWEGLKMMLNWNDPTGGPDYEKIQECYVTDAEGNTLENIQSPGFDLSNWSLYGLILNADLYTDGEQYTAHIVKGAFGNGDYDMSDHMSGRACPALEVLFTTENVLAINVIGEEPKDEVIYDITDATISANVADGVASIDYTFAEDLSLNINREHYQYPNLISGYTLTADGEAVDANVVMRAVNNRLILTIEPVSIDSDATYVLTLDKGLFGDDEWFASDYKAGHANDVIEFSFVPSAFRPALEYVTPEILIEKRNATADGSIEENGDPAIVVTLRFAFDIWWPEGFNFFNVCKLYGPDDNLVNITNTHQFYGSTSDYTIYKFEMWGFDMDSDQTYTLNVPAAIYGNTEWLNSNGRWGMCNEELNIQFIPGNYQNAGVEGVAVDAVANDVYNMQGVLILRDATAAQVKALPAGLYIVGGRKVAVK